MDGLYIIQPVIPILTRLFLRPEATAVWRDGPAVDRGDSKQRTGPEFDSHWGPGKIYCYTDFVCEGERMGARGFFFQLMTPTKRQQLLFGKQFIITLISSFIHQHLRIQICDHWQLFSQPQFVTNHYSNQITNLMLGRCKGHSNV